MKSLRFFAVILLAAGLLLVGCARQEAPPSPSPSPSPTPPPPPKAEYCHNNQGVCELTDAQVKAHQNDLGHTCANFNDAEAIRYSISGDTSNGQFKAILVKKAGTDDFQIKLDPCDGAPANPFKNSPPAGKTSKYDTGPAKDPNNKALIGKHYRLLIPDKKTGKMGDPHIVLTP
ncbi:MAG TPA: hypothetical protein VL382_03360, partial [Terriglobales bacterium]|nr:hypothetical protein [Terriglobales bacterium]